MITLFLIGCSKEEHEGNFPDLQMYLDRFEAEAALRGYDFDLSEVEVAFVEKIEVGGNTYCGYGWDDYNGTGRRRVEISTSARCKRLDTYTDLELESLMFHELGHAFLGRFHTFVKFCDGTPISMMDGETSARNHYSENEIELRDYYISELMDGSLNERCIDWTTNWRNDSAYYQYDLHEDFSWFLIDRDGDYIGAKEGRDVLSIETASNRTPAQAGNWLTTIYTELPDCANVTFKVNLNAENLEGAGAAISLRVFERDPITKFGAAYSHHETLYFTTTENPVSGHLSNHEEQLSVPCLSRDTWFIVLFVRLMPGTIGRVSFSDIRLIVEQL